MIGLAHEHAIAYKHSVQQHLVHKHAVHEHAVTEGAER